MSLIGATIQDGGKRERRNIVMYNIILNPNSKSKNKKKKWKRNWKWENKKWIESTIFSSEIKNILLVLWF